MGQRCDSWGVAEYTVSRLRRSLVGRTSENKLSMVKYYPDLPHIIVFVSSNKK